MVGGDVRIPAGGGPIGFPDMGDPDYDLIIIGMGSAGMTAAELAAALPLRVCAVERDRIGGDCLWTGCVPSKAFLAAARARTAGPCRAP